MHSQGGCKMKIEREQDEADKILIDEYIKGERKLTWYVCEIQGKHVLMPDTTALLGHDSYQIHRFKHWLPSPKLIVKAYPASFLFNELLAGEFMREMPFEEARFNNYIILSGIIESSKAMDNDRQ